MRYKTAIIRKDDNNKRYYRPTVIPNIPIKDTDIFMFPIFGDRFDTIAHRQYGDSNLWWIIAKANGYSKGELAPDPERKLRIPTEIGDIIEAVNRSNR